ncbi:MAG TPA: hypothetical protein VL137_11640, partial [Polyangiaceae bacterium]|nr:hypothetical protein [Polyangiaceae bacterium]
MQNLLGHKLNAWIGCAALLVSCGGSEPSPEYPSAPPKEAEPAVVKDQRPPAGTVWRDELIDTINAGLGAFLQHVEVEASLEEGHFQGFRVVQLITLAYWENVDVQPGDVVVSVNDMPIERETEAYAAFESLRTAKEIRVNLLRDGMTHQTVIRVTEREGVVPSTVAAPAPASSAASGAAANRAGSAASGGFAAAG